MPGTPRPTRAASAPRRSARASREPTRLAPPGGASHTTVAAPRAARALYSALPISKRPVRSPGARATAAAAAAAAAAASAAAAAAAASASPGGGRSGSGGGGGGNSGNGTPRRGAAAGRRALKVSAAPSAKSKAAALKAATAAAAAAVAVTRRRTTRTGTSGTPAKRASATPSRRASSATTTPTRRASATPSKRTSAARTPAKEKAGLRGMTKTRAKQTRKSTTPAKPKARPSGRRVVRKKMSEVEVDKAHGLLGKRIGLLWPEDGVFYDAMVLSFDEKAGLHKIYYYPTGASGEQIEVANLFDEAREWRMAPTQPSSDEPSAPEDPFAFVGTRISVEWPDRHVGERKMKGCEAVVVKYNTDKNYRVVYTQDDYVEDRDLSAATILPWQTATKENPRADDDGTKANDDHLRTDDKDGAMASPQGDKAQPGAQSNERGASATEPEPEPESAVPRIGDFTSAFDKTLERDLDFEVPSVRGPPVPVQLAPLPTTTQFGHTVTHGNSVNEAEAAHPAVQPAASAQDPAEEPAENPGLRRLIPTLPRFG